MKTKNKKEQYKDYCLCGESKKKLDLLCVSEIFWNLQPPKIKEAFLIDYNKESIKDSENKNGG